MQEAASVTSPPPVQVARDTFVRLLELLELAARRGAFELEEYRRIGLVFEAALLSLQEPAP
jgi:hypothetical protein